VVSIPAAAWFLHREAHVRPPASAPPHRGAEDERRILVVANETVAGTVLRKAVETAAKDVRSQVLVVVPALNTKLKHWLSDDDGARSTAEERLSQSIRALERDGIAARGEVGDADPLQAIEDALRTFGADLIIISTHPAGRSNWLERDVVSGARDRFAIPITHVVVDLAAESGAPPG
jgi:hypothetical protein